MIISFSFLLVACGPRTEKDRQGEDGITKIDTPRSKIDTVTIVDLLNKQSQNDSKGDILTFADSLYEYKEMFKCFYEDVSISKNCYYKNSINFDSLIGSLCKFVPYSLSVSSGGELPDGRETNVYYFECWDSVDLQSYFILLTRNRSYCDSIYGLFKEAWRLVYEAESKFPVSKFSLRSLHNRYGVSNVVVFIFNKAKPVSQIVTDIDFDVRLNDTVDVTIMFINMQKSNAIMCVDSNMLINDYNGWRNFVFVCYPKYPNSCPWDK